MGFGINRLIVDIEKFLGYDNLSEAIIVGAGGLGRAMLGYEGFKSNGLNIVAAFDVNQAVIGKMIAGKSIMPLESMKEFVETNNIRIGIITVPKEAAQEVLNQMVEAGIKAIWNFAPAPLRAPKDVVLKTEDLAASLAMLAGKLYRA
jgi:redox-sensing transcriptional repressor